MAFLLHQLLTERAARDPEKVAVAGPSYDGAKSITYGQLDALTTQLARRLRAYGVQPGDRVGLFLDKSIQAIAALLAVQKAGAAYVPLDPQAVPRRAAYMLGNCRVKALVGSAEKIARLPDEVFARADLTGLLLVEEGAAPPAAAADKRVCSFAAAAREESAEPLPTAITENDLAYILYTSGSTGEPKGVMISHRNAMAFVDWSVTTFALRAEDHLSSHAPLHFDLSILDVFGALAAGATIHLVPPEAALFPVKLARWIAESGITVWYSVPTALMQLVENGKLERVDLGKLRAVLFAGEVFPIKYLRRLVEKVPGPGYFNLYGPTETNVCTYHEVGPADLAPDRTEPVPIGKACLNSDCVVLDEDRRAVAEGGEGELYVSGPTVMRGYWGRPEDTARVVLADPFRPWMASSLYKTGDIVRRLPDGVFQYVGRKDKMIKSRGYRIELGEIEAAILAHPGVREAAVVAIPDEHVGARIRAFVVGEGVERHIIEQFCGERIPRYMMPERIDLRAALPRTSTGKIDRALLEKEA